VSQCFPPVSPEHGLEFRVQGLGFSHVKVISTCPPAPARAHTHTFTCRSTGIGVACGVCRVVWRVSRRVNAHARSVCVSIYLSIHLSILCHVGGCCHKTGCRACISLYLSQSVCLSVCLSVSPKYIHTYRSISHLSSIYLSIDGGQEGSTKSAGVGCRVWGVGWRV